MYYKIRIANEARLRHWVQTGEWVAEEKIVKFAAHDVSADIREYIAYGAGVCKDNDMFDALSWRVARNDDGTFALRSSIRLLDLDDDEIERYNADIIDQAFWLRELERDAREWRAARDALNYLDAQKEAMHD